MRNYLIYPELSYVVMGILFKIHNRLGRNFQEKYYQRAIEIEFKASKLPFEREKLIKITYQGEIIGRYFLDFVIDEKLVLEVKASDYFRNAFYPQVLAYLTSANLKLGIIANFNSDNLLYKRIVNPKLP